jgi:hypothetical protein
MTTKYTSAINYTKWPDNLPNDQKIYHTHPWQEPQKFSQIGIFGLKTKHLAILLGSTTNQLFSVRRSCKMTAPKFFFSKNYYCQSIPQGISPTRRH